MSQGGASDYSTRQTVQPIGGRQSHQCRRGYNRSMNSSAQHCCVHVKSQTHISQWVGWVSKRLLRLSHTLPCRPCLMPPSVSPSALKGPTATSLTRHACLNIITPALRIISQACHLRLLPTDQGPRLALAGLLLQESRAQGAILVNQASWVPGVRSPGRYNPSARARWSRSRFYI